MKDGKLHGFGYFRVGKNVYEGGFKDGKKHGCAKDTWPNGDYFEGAFTDGHMGPYGSFTWASKGVTYRGQWKDGKRHGFGEKTRTTTDANG